MTYWRLFWTAALLLAGSSFAAITLIVTVRGYRDLLSMFSGLRAQQGEREQ